MADTMYDHLPHRARGMDFDKFSWEARPDGKVHFFSKGPGGFHWTLHPDTGSGVFDVHETWLNPNGTEVHNTLLMIKSGDLLQMLNELGPVVVPGLLAQFRPLSLGWLKRRKLTIVRDQPYTPSELAAVTERNRRKRLELNIQSLQQAMETPTTLEGMFRMPDGPFSLLAIRRGGTKRVGVGLKLTDPTGVAHLLRASTQGLLDWAEQVREFIEQVAPKYLIPPEDYPKYLRC